MSWLTQSLNTAWMWKCSGELAAFQRATSRVAATQAKLLAALVGSNQNSEFGRAHRFDQVRTPADFQARVAPSLYADYRTAIDRIAAGKPNVLTRDAVTLLEPTSGTTGDAFNPSPEKLIPYTPGLRRQFQRGVAAWIANLLRERPSLRQGRAYWSISPAVGPPRRTASGIPIGFDDDAAYLGRAEQFALRHLLVTSPLAARIADLEAFRYFTLLSLLAAHDLAFISIWNPSFLTALFTPLRAWSDRLCHDLRRGTFNPPVPIEPALAQKLSQGLKPAARRAAEVAALLRGGLSFGELTAALWPKLGLISCWGDAAAASALLELREWFPAVEVQPKGLLATEGFVSFPLVDQPAAALALRCHFFEFEERSSSADPSTPGIIRLAHELEEGGCYRVLMTTAGGLYRYQLRDEVEIVSRYNQCPLLRFLGKADCVSDRVGEKLAEPQVRAVLERAFRTQSIAPHFTLLVPVEERPTRYVLYLQLPRHAELPFSPEQLASEVHAGLCENLHYRYAAGLGQLGPLDVRLLDPQGASARAVYERRCLARGQKAAVIKPAVLDPWAGWSELFQPLLQPAPATTDDTPSAPPLLPEVPQ